MDALLEAFDSRHMLYSSSIPLTPHVYSPSFSPPPLDHSNVIHVIKLSFVFYVSGKFCRTYFLRA
jgi:hypothetical protein